VAGAAHGAMDLVVIGLLISLPIVVLGSTVVLRLVERFPSIIALGSAVLALTAAQMVCNEPWLAPWLGLNNGAADEGTGLARYGVYVLAVVGVLLAGRFSQAKATTPETPAA